MIDLISSVLVYAAAAVILIRIAAESGIDLGGSRFIAVLTNDKSIKGGFSATKKEVAGVFGIAAVFRVIVFVLSIFAIYMAQDRTFSWQDMTGQYLKWDANNYQRIAIGGYSYHMENGDYTTLAFFPLYPWLVRLAAVVLRDEIVSGIIVSGLLYAGACSYMYKLLSIDYSKQTAIRAVVYMSVFPHALFFGVMMNESALLFTMCATLYYIRTHRWWLVGIFGALAALSRMVGILLAIPAAVEWLEHYKIFEKLRQRKIGEVWRLFYSKGLWIFLMLLGTGIYLFCNYKTTGKWFMFLEYQGKYWSNGSCRFGRSIQTIFNRAKEDDGFTRFTIWLPELAAVAFVIATLLYGVRRHRSMYTAFLLMYIMINTGFEWPISIARYLSCAMPAFIVTADFSARHKWTEPIITATMAISFGIFLVVYFMGRQVL